MKSNYVGLGFALGTFFYIGSGILLELLFVPYFLPRDAYHLPYGQQFIFYILVSACLGAIGGQVAEWSRQGDAAKASVLGITIGIGSILVVVRCMRSIPKPFSVFDPSNIVLYGPLTVITLSIFVLGIQAIFRPMADIKVS